jgi:hypothetical protein
MPIYFFRIHSSVHNHKSVVNCKEYYSNDFVAAAQECSTTDSWKIRHDENLFQCELIELEGDYETANQVAQLCAATWALDDDKTLEDDDLILLPEDFVPTVPLQATNHTPLVVGKSNKRKADEVDKKI